MSLRKVSSLPGLNVDSVDFNIDRFKDSLFEISYEQDDPHTYKSMYIDGENLVSSVISAGNIIEMIESKAKVLLRDWTQGEQK